MALLTCVLDPVMRAYRDAAAFPACLLDPVVRTDGTAAAFFALALLPVVLTASALLGGFDRHKLTLLLDARIGLLDG